MYVQLMELVESAESSRQILRFTHCFRCRHPDQSDNLEKKNILKIDAFKTTKYLIITLIRNLMKK